MRHPSSADGVAAAWRLVDEITESRDGEVPELYRPGTWGPSAGGYLSTMLGTAGHVAEFGVGAHLDLSSRVQRRRICVDFPQPSDPSKLIKRPRFVCVFAFAIDSH